MLDAALRRQIPPDSQCFWCLPPSLPVPSHLLPPSFSCTSVKPPPFEHIPQQRAVIDGVWYTSPNGQPHRVLDISCRNTDLGVSALQRVPVPAGVRGVGGESEATMLGDTGGKGCLAKRMKAKG